MELLYRGFDGLDVSFQGHIDHRLCKALELAKERAQKFHRDDFLEWRGVGMLVKENGAKGGYAFVVRTSAPEAVWFFKKPKQNDPWGIRVSCSSFQLALHGFGQTRAELYEVLSQLNIGVEHGGESVGRVDYAMDFLAPTLIVDPSNFVMHSNSRRRDHHSEFLMVANGNSGRVTSVTVGQMPGRQVIVYDKRAEVIAKRKVGWFTIWDSAREKELLPRLDYSDPTQSRVWRVELRAGKRLLKDKWAIRSWEQLDESLGDLFSQSLQAIRYAMPTSDTNRARWSDDPLWVEAKKVLEQDLFEMRSFASPSAVKQVQFEAHDELLLRQIAGLITSKAALHQINIETLSLFAKETGNKLAREIEGDFSRYERRLIKAKARISVTHGMPKYT